MLPLNACRALVFTVAAILFALAAGRAVALNADVTHYKLDNGLEVVIVPDRRAPVVTHMVWYRVGSADEPQGQAGLAHFLEHLLFKGTEKYPPGEFSKIVRRIGGEDNAFTSKDYTAYFQRIAKEHLGFMMELEADRMQNLVLSENDVATELQVVLEERNSRVDNDPSSLLSEQLSAVLYTAHPYRKPVIGWRPEIEQLSLEGALSFYRRFYTPSNAIVVVVGDVEPDEVRALVDKHYAPLPNTVEIGPRVRNPEPEPIAARRVVLKDARTSTPSVQRFYLTPSYPTDTGREAEALEILGEALGGGTTSRLYRELVVKDKVAAYAGGWFSGDNLDNGRLGVYAAPNPGGDVAETEMALDRVLAEVAANGITQEEMDRARDKLIADMVYTLDSQMRLANLFGEALTTGRTIEDVTGWSDRIREVTLDDVKAVAAKYIREERSATGVLLPRHEGQTVNN